MLDIQAMNIRAANLNWLVAFDALLEERNVTRAARRVGVTQPAMSHSLQKLRELFDDPLFVRKSHGLLPTPRALELGLVIQGALASIEGALAPARFDPTRDERRFVVAASDYVEFVLLPPLLRRLGQQAPGVVLEVRPWGLHEVPDALARNEVSLMLGFYDELPPKHKAQRLFEEEYVCIVRRGHPQVRKELSLERYLKLGHVLVSQRADSPGSVDRALQKRGQRRHVAARVSHFLMVPQLVANSDLVAAVSRRVAEPFAKALGLRVLAPPLQLPRGRVSQVWHEQLDNDPAHRYLRETIAEVAARV